MWQKKQKVAEQREASDDEEDDRQQFHPMKKRSRYGNKSTKISGDAPKVRSELKTKEQILKERRRKERIQSYQNYRKTQNSKRGSGRGRRKS